MKYNCTEIEPEESREEERDDEQTRTLEFFVPEELHLLTDVEEPKSVQESSIIPTATLMDKATGFKILNPHKGLDASSKAHFKFINRTIIYISILLYIYSYFHLFINVN